MLTNGPTASSFSAPLSRAEFPWAGPLPIARNVPDRRADRVSNVVEFGSFVGSPACRNYPLRSAKSDAPEKLPRTAVDRLANRR